MSKEIERLRALLEQVARNQETVACAACAREVLGREVWGEAELHQALGRQMEAIGRAEWEAGRPLLTAVAVDEGGLPPTGFFALAGELESRNPLSGPFMVMDRDLFFAYTLGKVHEYWRRRKG